MSCNGCRILRKGCSDTCILRPSIQWLDTAEAQAHATVFVAKFFGRAGLMSFISAVPETQRPALFQSLLFEAAGRTVSPVTGAVGLLSSGNWHLCQAAVDTILRGGAVSPVPEFLNEVSDCTDDIYKIEGPAAASASRRKALKPRRWPESASDDEQVADLDLSLTTSSPAKKSQPSLEIRRLGSTSMNSEESAVTTCGNQPAPERELLKLF